jgi:hypothetical protein
MLKKTLHTAPSSAYPQPRERFGAETGMIIIRIGGMLSKEHDRQEQVIANCSKMLIKAERNYYVIWWELLAIMCLLEHFHKYLYRQEFHLRTDYSTLTLI